MFWPGRSRPWSHIDDDARRLDELQLPRFGFPACRAGCYGWAIGYVWSGMSVENLPPGMFGYIYWPALLVLVFFSVILAPVGAKAAHALPVGTLKRIFAFMLFGLAAYMLYKSSLSFGWIS